MLLLYIINNNNDNNYYYTYPIDGNTAIILYIGYCTIGVVREQYASPLFLSKNHIVIFSKYN